jgi:hypothetical protein
MLGDISYDEDQYTIDTRGFLIYIGTSLKPTQPKGLTKYCYMFSKENTLGGNLDLSDWDMSEATNLDSMFFHEKSGRYISIDINSLKDWDVSKVTDFRFCFQSYYGFVGVLKKWDMRNARFVYGMFNGIVTLKDISKLGKWNLVATEDEEYILHPVSSEDY